MCGSDVGRERVFRRGVRLGWSRVGDGGAVLLVCVRWVVCTLGGWWVVVGGGAFLGGSVGCRAGGCQVCAFCLGRSVAHAEVSSRSVAHAGWRGGGWVGIRCSVRCGLGRGWGVSWRRDVEVVCDLAFVWRRGRCYREGCYWGPRVGAGCGDACGASGGTCQVACG